MQEAGVHFNTFITSLQSSWQKSDVADDSGRQLCGIFVKQWTLEDDRRPESGLNQCSCVPAEMIRLLVRRQCLRYVPLCRRILLNKTETFLRPQGRQGNIEGLQDGLFKQPFQESGVVSVN